jgi:hypothetical protein
MSAKMAERALFKIKKLMFHSLGMEEIADLRRRQQLEDSMGFRGQWEAHRDFQINLLKNQGLLRTSRLLEIGCGPMTGGIPIIQYLDSGCYTGVDVRDSVLDLAWQEVGRAGLSRKNARLICSPNFAQSELVPNTFDFIFSFSVLFHLDDTLLNEFFFMVFKLLGSQGKCIANVNTEAPDSTWLRFPFRRRTIEQYRSAAAQRRLKTNDLGEIASLGFNGPGLEKRNRLLVFQKL